MDKPDRLPKIVIIGAGFGGVRAIQALTHAQADILVVDRSNYHTFFPLLYQVAAAELEPEAIVHPVRSLLRKRGNTREVYVVGDLAHLEVNGNALPMVAPVAVQQADLAARNILRQMRLQEPLPFEYHDPGTMVTIGRNAAVVNLGRYSFTGFIAWLMWVGVHLFKLIDFRNRLLVIINWAWDYLFFERVVRLIIPAPKKPS